MKIALVLLAAFALKGHAQSQMEVQESPVKVTIDMTTQSIVVESPETRVQSATGTLIHLVSTGGGWKNPVDPQTGKPDTPYCADNETPQIDRLYIPANEKTMFRYKKSNRFTSADGAGVPMPFAIHVQGGIYLHEVPPSYVGKLGDNVSGGCIRLSHDVAEFLFASMAYHGSIELTITGQSRPKCKGNPPSPAAVAQTQPHVRPGEPVPWDGDIPADWVNEGPVQRKKRTFMDYFRR